MNKIQEYAHGIAVKKTAQNHCGAFSKFLSWMSMHLSHEIVQTFLSIDRNIDLSQLSSDLQNMASKCQSYSSKLATQATKEQKARNNFEALHKKFNGFPTMQVKAILFVFFFIDFFFSRKKQVIDEYAIPILKETLDLYKKVFFMHHFCFADIFHISRSS